MSFLDIKDPRKRDAIVADYLATVKRIQKNNLNDHSNDLLQTAAIEQHLEPVVRSTDESTKAITDQLIPIKQEIAQLNKNLMKNENVAATVIHKHDKPSFIDKIYQKHASKVDKYFGIVKYSSGLYKMGNKYVQLDDNNIIVDDKKYRATEGFLNLVMMRSPRNYTKEDLRNYRDLVEQTHTMKHPNNLNVGSNIKGTMKWRHIFPLFSTIDNEPKNNSVAGNGVVEFLPSDISQLQTKLCYLLGEFRAGNTTTRQEIVPISDELLRQKKISLEEYNHINNFLQTK